MPRNLGTSETKTFVKGLISEATGLNFPEDACTAALNCRFSNTGEISRRLGFNYEENHTNETYTRNGSVISEYVWNAVAGTGNLIFVVVQVGNVIKFYGVDENESLSPNLQTFEIDLEDYNIHGSPRVKKAPAQFTSGRGLLFIAHPYCDPLFVKYDPDTQDITVNQYQIKIRDLDGVSDGLRIEERPATLSKKHHYNLYNQGWFSKVDFAHFGPSLGDPISSNVGFGGFYEAAGVYPSNADIWWLFKDEFNAFRPNDQLNTEVRGNTLAPKGHFILEAFFQDRSAATEHDCTETISGIDVVSSGYQRPQCIAFYAGRIWYAGVNSQDFSSKVYFSQILDKNSKTGLCYQADDPTSEALSDLLDTDGGVIDIQEIGNVVKLFPMKGALLVFASNGIWSIGGTQQAGFRATDFTVEKIASIQTLSHTSFVDIFGVPLWWTLDGIYTVTPNQVGILEARSLTDQTIKTYFDAIPSNSKRYAKGSFNYLTKEIQWLFNSTDQASSGGGTSALSASDLSIVDATYNYSDILCLNTLTGAFYPFAIDTSEGKLLNGAVVTQGTGLKITLENVVDNTGNTILDAAGEVVQAGVFLETSFAASSRYLVSKLSAGNNWDFSFALEKDETYVDWGDKDYSSEFTTGYRVRGQGLMFGQVNYIVTYTRTMLDSSLFMQVIWDYANSTNSNRLGRYNQMYPNRPYYDVQEARTRLRGKGRAVQLKYFSESGKPFRCIGWATLEAVNAQP